jgi:hypothetical protein
MVYSRNLYQSLLLNAGDIHPTSWNLGGRGRGGVRLFVFALKIVLFMGGGGGWGGGNLSDAQPTHFENHPTLKRVKEIYENSSKKQQMQQQQQRGHFFLLTFLCSFFFTGDAIEIQKYLAGTTAG